MNVLFSTVASVTLPRMSKNGRGLFILLIILQSRTVSLLTLAGESTRMEATDEAA